MNTPKYTPPKNASLDASAGVMAVAPFEKLSAEQRHALRVAADRKNSPARQAARAARATKESQS
jgi:hypothetical protein